MNVLSLFDGMSCGQIALGKAGIEVKNYYASEIDRHAIKVAQKNYPNTIQLGDVQNWKEWDIDWSNVDLLIGGSPCQGFSSAGKGLAFDDTRSRLFFVYVDILNYIKKRNNKVKFMLENVRMKKEWLDIISSHLGVDPIAINSDLITACERPRFYWSNWNFSEVQKVNIVAGDIIDFSSNENKMSESWHLWWKKNSYFQQKKSYSRIVRPDGKLITMTARQYASWNGNFIPCPGGGFRKPLKQELAKLVGAPRDYFDCTSQRQAELMTGNGWSVDVVSHIFKGIADE